MDDSRRTKRTKRYLIAATILLTVLAFPPSEGPATYAAVRGWIPNRVLWIAYRPMLLLERLPVLNRQRDTYLRWWQTLGLRHHPRYKIETRIGELDVYAASDAYCSAFIPEDGPHRIFIAGRWMFMVERQRVVVEDLFTNHRQDINIPTDSQRVEIEYFDGRLTLEVDGTRVDVPDWPL